MRFDILLLTLGVSTGVGALSVREPENADSLMLDLNNEAIQALEDREGSSATKRSKDACNLLTATVRKDWAALSTKERTNYINAVKCLQTKPSKSDRNWAPGVRSRYDDFLAIHIDKTPQIHRTGNFLTWHRHFVWSYEKALQDECGYKGAQPYWNWFAHQQDITKSPVFDGSSTSFGGTGAYVKHDGVFVGKEQIFLPPGQGGGCVLGGPFKDMTVNLGPVRPGMVALPPSPTGPLGYNPHCLRRDLTNTPLSYMNANNLLNVTVGAASHNIGLFQDELQGRFPDGFIGMHAAGHFVAGGDATDVYSSPSDPTFFLHHAMVDRLYWVWQVLHPSIANTIKGTITMGNNPPSRDAVTSDILDLGAAGSSIPLKDAFNTLGGAPFCYIYL